MYNIQKLSLVNTCTYVISTYVIIYIYIYVRSVRQNITTVYKILLALLLSEKRHNLTTLIGTLVTIMLTQQHFTYHRSQRHYSCL